MNNYAAYLGPALLSCVVVTHDIEFAYSYSADYKYLSWPHYDFLDGCDGGVFGGLN